MTEARKEEWRPQVAELVRRYADATTEEQHAVVAGIAERWDDPAATSWAAAEFAKTRSVSAPAEVAKSGGEQNKITEDPKPFRRRQLSPEFLAAQEAEAKRAEAFAKNLAALRKPKEEAAGKDTPTLGEDSTAAIAEREVAKPVARLEPAPRVVGPPILSPNAPFDTAKVFAERHCRRDEANIVWFWQGQFWRWNERFYAPEPDEVMRGHVYAFLDGACKWAGQNQTVRFQPTPRHVNEVLDCLKTGLALGVECQPPMWLSTRKPATEWIVFRNGIVNVLTGELRALCADLWAQSALDFDWDAAAECPAWDGFLDAAFPGDAESKQFIEEWMGYCMTEETRFQKGAMLIGLKRSGKGTISHVLRQMVGDTSYVGLSFNTWAASENSKECLIGKRVGVFADVRFKPGRAYGASFDPGGIGHVSTEMLLNIIGEDTVTIGRKYKQPWHGQLRLKLMLISNEVPNLNDPGGVLPSRFVKVRFGVSFFGREDVNLRDKLSAELSGIAARCVRAYQRLCERGRFVQPRSAEALEREVLAASDPFAAMAHECFVPAPEGMVLKAVAYGRFDRWCRENSRFDILRTTPNNRFGGKLSAIAGFERLKDFRPAGKGRMWVGIELKPEPQ